MNNAKLLLVDDEPLNLKLFDKMLKEHHYQILTATNGKECLEKVQAYCPDLVILDWNMPVMHGIEVLEILKKDPENKDIPVLMITGVMTSPEDLSYAMTIGAIDFLKKPFDKQELNARVKNILLLYQSMNALKTQNSLLEDKNRFINSLIDSIPHPIIYYSTEGIILMCNTFFEECSGTGKSDLLGKSAYHYFRTDEVAFHVQKDIELIESRESITYEKNIFPGDAVFIVSKNLIVDNQDNPIGIIAVFTDVTELKKAHEDVVNTKKIELISSSLRVMHLNEMNNRLIRHLEEVKPHASKEGQDLIQQIVSQFKMSITEKIWNELETRFEDTFDSFYKALLEMFPALTPNERKLCALLRSGLSSKDIALLTFQNPQSVDVARYRLRKKLHLTNEENITDFLLMLDK
ncbi:MAG: response regulator [Mariniphaga sp.]|nr:response regulator [Mariniphaga sp.]